MRNAHHLVLSVKLPIRGGVFCSFIFFFSFSLTLTLLAELQIGAEDGMQGWRG